MRRAKLLKRQPRVFDRRTRRWASEPCPPRMPPPALRKQQSYPQFAPMVSPPQHLVVPMNRTVANMDHENADTVPRLDRNRNETPFACSTPTVPSFRASHTPAVRSGPPLSCNFCWNTVDKCGRILRRKTQYHCPECRTNLCIVPCFHEYHEVESEVR